MLRNPNDAADATQETFEAALQALEGFRGEASLRTWIFGIARRRCIDRLRKHTRRKTDVSDEMDVHPDERPLQDERFHQRQGALALQDLISELPEIDRSILLLRFDHGLSFHEIGVTLGMRGDTAKVRAHRALVRLRPLLEKRGFGR
jgi:RNA polymerase sigma-70 factor (ECF subfamily)